MSDLDWTVLDDERVTTILTSVSLRVGTPAMPADDVYQEGSILLAQNAAKARDLLDDEMVGEYRLSTWLLNRLRDIVRPAKRTADREMPLDDLIARHRADEEGV